MNRATKILGNLLIFFAVASTLYIYFPLLRAELTYRTHSSQSQTPVSTDFGIVIDKLGINDSITRNVDPFNQSEYLPVLEHSVAHAAGTSLPGTGGNTFLFAHSSDNPFSITRYNTSFYLLDRLDPGDQITLYYQNQPYHYQVRQLQVVKPWQVQALTQNSSPGLVLQTCTPVGTSINRLLVFADPV